MTHSTQAAAINTAAKDLAAEFVSIGSDDDDLREWDRDNIGDLIFTGDLSGWGLEGLDPCTDGGEALVDGVIEEIAEIYES